MAVYCIDCKFLRKIPAIECTESPANVEVPGNAIFHPKMVVVYANPYDKNKDNDCSGFVKKVFKEPDPTPPGKMKLEKEKKDK